MENQVIVDGLVLIQPAMFRQRLLLDFGQKTLELVNLKTAVEHTRDLQKLERESGTKRRHISLVDLWRRDKPLYRQDLAKIGCGQLPF
jgi:hypothetical protein